ncbi:hypothetical protein E2C01_081438 [Portunus trituberculatus]|uniref:Uncharacterized protein n=1 Tax=Portunus trituberculatus TaxID=210409 RepID=A0A5B7J2B5_PORTR|nr:hypothetical protein [Portunus trituberculatus]
MPTALLILVTGCPLLSWPRCTRLFFIFSPLICLPL